MKLNFIIYIILAILLNTFNQQAIAQSSINLREQLTEEKLKEWDAYIKEYAPADSAFRVVAELANRHYYANRSAVTRYIYKLYREHFPNYDTLFDRMINIHTEIMLSQTPTSDMNSFYYDYIQKNVPNRSAFIALQRLAEPIIVRRQWDSAVSLYNYFKPSFPNFEEKFDEIILLLSADEEGIELRNIGNLINTRRNEWDPNPTPDGKYLFFSADHRAGGQGDSDVWFSEFKNGMWQKAQNLGRAVNADKKETIDNVSLDGNTLLLSGDFAGTYGKFDIYTIERTESGWGQLVHLPKPVNSIYVDEGAYLTSDGNALIFTSDRPGGVGEFREFGSYFEGSLMGNMDIYVSVKDEKGLWGQPINLGETVNTPYAERSPFLHPDGKTLYFSSDGHTGLGRLDVFKSVRLSDTSWTEWSKPINLGKEINSPLDDWGYKVGVSGDSAFFAAFDHPEGFGGWDIYSISLPQSAKPSKVITLSGKVKDSKGNPLSAKIKWEDLSTGKAIGSLNSDPRDGSYFIALPTGKNYGYYAEKQGYYPISNNIDLTDDVKLITLRKDIVMASIDDLTRDTIRITINNIFFDFDQYKLKNESKPELERLVTFLEYRSDLKVEIEGHTDNIGSDEYNLNLSELRAKAVKDYLVDNNINPKRIIYRGYGSRHPIAPNDTSEGSAMNRRVSIFFKE